MNCSLSFPIRSPFALNVALLCTVPIGFTGIICGIRCYLMWVSEAKKELDIIQQHSYRQARLRIDGLSKN